jgi:hypothetical protein
MVLAKRVEKLEKVVLRSRVHLVHVMPGQTVAQALKAHRRKEGPVPSHAELVFIRHTFSSAI